ncbi:hypothetical protein Poli38472_006534 [Pythium oligandrum]|uniref:Uncharacterized protein n=1 Tax=Pythium oligandrum TaxID=41045 RepID=A0A8K1FF77_PYTOL|nr:hypothetical protein Poli38472_006528 [Pythium oligandrum]TMW56524.1 hypothetical protein Poli38472_006534 [Pythium oligandrum]|eukprot:TMW56518.1 hypothetical protein Poli38472_006528 [Pythium oligandrum]
MLRSLFTTLAVTVLALTVSAQDIQKDDEQVSLTINTPEPQAVDVRVDPALPSSVTLTGERDRLMQPASEEEPKDDNEAEQFRRGGYGFRHRFYHPYHRRGYYGWRYPMPYWNTYGRRYYGGGCGYGRAYGGYYYC